MPNKCKRSHKKLKLANVSELILSVSNILFLVLIYFEYFLLLWYLLICVYFVCIICMPLVHMCCVDGESCWFRTGLNLISRNLHHKICPHTGFALTKMSGSASPCQKTINCSVSLGVRIYLLYLRSPEKPGKGVFLTIASLCIFLSK